MKLKWGRLIAALLLYVVAALFVLTLSSAGTSINTKGLMLLTTWSTSLVSTAIVGAFIWTQNRKLLIALSVLVVPFIAGIVLYLVVAEVQFFFAISALGFGLQLTAATIWFVEGLLSIQHKASTEDAVATETAEAFS